MRKQDQIEEFKSKEQELYKKLENQELRSREEIKSLLEKIENNKISWFQNESQVSGQREAERVKELREIFEKKV